MQFGFPSAARVGLRHGSTERTHGSAYPPVRKSPLPQGLSSLTRGFAGISISRELC